MKNRPVPSFCSLFPLISGLALLEPANGFTEINVSHERVDSSEARGVFRFKKIPAPAKADLASTARFEVLDGTRDGNGGTLTVLSDGKLPNQEDQPGANFFFEAGTKGGRILIDLGNVVSVKQFNSYSWHGDSRGPQIYTLYGSTGEATGFDPKTKSQEPEKAGWMKLGKVDTRPRDGIMGGQHAVSVSSSDGLLGMFRYFLMDVSPTSDTDRFGNTFYSEIDVVDVNAAPEVSTTAAEEAPGGREVVQAGKFQLTFDTEETPDLTEWVTRELIPVAKEWYPKLAAMLPSEGFEPPEKVTIRFFKDMNGVADASGSRIRCAADWFRKNLKGEARGAVVHELVHVVQQYGRARRTNPNATRTPGWLVEGIPDYIRFFMYEQPSGAGAEITKRNFSRARYDGNYRISGNFLNWVSTKFDKDLLVKLNTACREGKYNEAFWKHYTGKTLLELGEDWREEAAKKLGLDTLVVSKARLEGSALVQQKKLLAELKKSAAEAKPEMRELGEKDSTNALKYYLFKPKNYEKGKSYPLILWLHGKEAGKSVDDLLVSNAYGIGRFVSADTQSKNSSFVVVPWSGEKRWDTGSLIHISPQTKEPASNLKPVVDMLSSLTNEFQIDSKKIYVAGQGTGAFGTWDIITRHPQLFAAAIPVGGGGDPLVVNKVKTLPIWAFHGAADSGIKAKRTRSMIQGLEVENAKPLYWEYEGLGHEEAAERAFSEPDLVSWLFSQEKK